MIEDRTTSISGNSVKAILVQTKPDSTGKCSIKKFIYNPDYERHIILKSSEINERNEKREGIDGFGIFTKDLIQYFSWDNVSKIEIINEDHIINLLRDDLK
jgi:hypothetical protein